MGPIPFDQAVVDAISSMAGSWGFWMFIGIITLIFQSSVKDVGYGLTWRIGSGFRKNIIVRIGGQYARISHLGLFKTEFNFYTLDEAGEYVISGESCPVPNSRLRDMDIRIPLPLLDLPAKKLRKAIYDR